jgi:hypothetical protein
LGKKEFMILFRKLAVLTMVSASGLGLATFAHAQDVDYTYEFEATSGSTAFDGSTITVQVAAPVVFDTFRGLIPNLEIAYDRVVAWDLTDGTYTLDSSLGGPSADSDTGLSQSFITSASTAGFVGSFSVDGHPTSLPGEVLTFNGDPTSLSDVITDEPDPGANGIWNYVPDTASTFGLLLGGMGSMGVIRRRMAAK